jgi:polysaccharide export outer membrane protein
MNTVHPEMFYGKPLALWLVISLLLPACASDVPQKVLSPVPEKPEIRIKTTNAPIDLARLAELKKISQTEFRLGKGDVLSISVYGEPDLSLSNVTIRPDGHISYRLIGDVQADGLTVNELTASITQALAAYVKGPKVSVIVQKFTSLEYTLAGEVVHPGVFPLLTDVSLTKAIAKSGGLTKGQFHASSVELADLSHAFIARDNEVLPIDFVRLLRGGDLRYDIPLKPGDYIYIPSGLSKEVYVLGEVGRADLFAFQEDIGLSQALAQAKGFTEYADLSRIHIIRGSLHNPERIIADFNQVMAGKIADFELQPGDVVFVPPTNLTKWSRIVKKIIPSMQALQTGLILNGL